MGIYMPKSFGKIDNPELSSCSTHCLLVNQRVKNYGAIFKQIVEFLLTSDF